MSSRRSSRLTSKEDVKTDDISVPIIPPKAKRAPKRKASTSNGVPNGEETVLPITPKKRANKAANPPPLTPTPSAIKVIADAADPITPKSKSKKIRKADPHATNAPLQTPGGSKVVKSYPNLFEGTASGKVKEEGGLTTDNLLEKACEHLCSIDPKLKPWVQQHTCEMFTAKGLSEEIDPFVALVSSIISQQVSGAAASSIKKKFIGLFPKPEGASESHFPSPAEVASAKLEFTRTAGLSQRKAEYIQGLAEKFASGELSAQMLVDASDEELLEKLIAVRGLGRWSVEMFATFALKRMDIFSTGDLGVQKGVAVYAGKDVGKLRGKGGKWKYMQEKDMLEIANKFVPYRSLFMWYMWKMSDIKLEALED
jgi:DNA-3-methyladenine glycosylase II